MVGCEVWESFGGLLVGGVLKNGWAHVCCDCLVNYNSYYIYKSKCDVHSLKLVC